LAPPLLAPVVLAPPLLVLVVLAPPLLAPSQLSPPGGHASGLPHSLQALPALLDSLPLSPALEQVAVEGSEASSWLLGPAPPAAAAAGDMAASCCSSL
jgi:hypothetical protein